MDTIDLHVADPLEGQLLGGRYRIIGRVARGGRAGGGATVYQARDELLERGVSIKIANTDDPEVARRLTDEAETAARLSHPNTVAVFDRGTHHDAPFLVMEFVRGRSLRDVMAERRRLDPSESLAILEQILAALAVAHRAGMVHREVTPDSILITPPPNGSGDLVDAVVKVADIGLVRAVEFAPGTAIARSDADYVAPELLAEGRADTRADVYSTGIVLYEMLTGRVPPTGQGVAPPSRMAHGVPQLLDDLVMRATRTDPTARPRDAAAMLSEIQSAREDVGALAGPTRAIAPPTVAVPSLDSTRPSWARLHTLPATPAARARRAFGGALGRAGALTRRLRSTPEGRRAVVASVIVVGLLLLVGGWWLGFGRYTDTPAFTHLTRDNAIAEASRLGFTVEFAAGQYSEDVPIDTVLDQRPPAGNRIVSGGMVTLVLSLGPERYPVPNVAGQHVDVATSRLKEHFVVSTRDGYSDTLPAGYVVATDPPVGTALAPNTEVTLIVARGPFPVHVPSVVGRLLSTARSQLQSDGFTDIDVQYRENSGQPKDTVLEQTPAGGQGMETAAGVKVTLIVASAAKVEMPNVMNAACPTAKTQLEGLGFEVQVQGNVLQQLTGKVDQQTPAAGTTVDEGSAVEIRCQ